MQQICPPARFPRSRGATRRRSAAVSAALLVALALGSCSSSEPDSSSSVTSSDSASTDATSTDATSTDASASTAGSPDTSDSSDDSTGAPPAVDCSMVPSEDLVESVIGAPVLPVEAQSVGCAYIGDGNNVGVYFDIPTDAFDIESFDTPDPQFATMVDDPGLPPGSFVQSGDFYAKKNGVVYVVIAGVNGTDADDALAQELMIAWLASIG